MSEREWQRLALQHKRELDLLFERQLENMQNIMKQSSFKSEQGDTLWDPFYDEQEYRLLGSPPEAPYSSKQMDKIRRLQKIIHEYHITKKWQKLSTKTKINHNK